MDDAVAEVLTAHGHLAMLLRDELSPASSDNVVAFRSEALAAVLVSHDSDFRAMAPRIPLGRLRFARLSRIALRCTEKRAQRRLELALPFIAFEWEQAQRQRDSRMILEIGESYLRTNR